MVKPIGRVLFINRDGGPQFTAHLSMPAVLRSPELSTIHGVYRQNHQTDLGQHVYKYERPLVGPADTDLSDYREPSDSNWDGPQGAKPLATWALVHSVFEQLIVAGECSVDDLTRLLAITHAAFHKLSVPDPPAEILQAIPAAVIEG